MNHLGALAAHAAESVPSEEVRAKAALVLADTLAPIVGGSVEAEVQALTGRLCTDATGEVLIIGPGRRTDPKTAALLNGTAGTALEMDEGHQFCKGHPAIYVIQAVLAAAQYQHPSRQAILTAIAVGYEAAAWVGIATQLRPSMHGTWGPSARWRLFFGCRAHHRPRSGMA